MLLKLWAVIKFLLFGFWTIFHIGTSALFGWIYRPLGVWQFHIYVSGLLCLLGVKIKKHGDISKYRPLLIVSNHISVFEIFVFPTVFKNVFFAKAEMKKWFPLNLATKNMGNCFIDRRFTHAKEAIDTISHQMKTSKYPFAIFPEGTTSNGSYVLPFKSAMFEFIDLGSPAKIQPVVIAYRDRYNKKIPPQVMADEYAYFANAKQLHPPYAKKELSVIELMWHTMNRGGFVVEIHVLPVFDTTGFDRKSIAKALHEIVSKKFEEIN